MNKFIVTSLFLVSALMNSAMAEDLISKAPEHAQAYFISPQSGNTVTQTFNIQFGLKGMGVAPAGFNKENTGHHHLLINTDIGDLDLSAPLPATDKVKHFGGGQTETQLTLPAGTHTLQLLLGNYIHIAHDKPVVSEKITVVVE